jgi:hypothetical protein
MLSLGRINTSKPIEAVLESRLEQANIVNIRTINNQPDWNAYSLGHERTLGSLPPAISWVFASLIDS